MRKELSLEVNKLCNFHCSFCYTEKYREDLPELPLVLDVIKQGVDSGIESISLTGGEPLLQWKRVKAICAYAKTFNLRTRLNTNGILLSPGAKTDDLIKVVDDFQISFNALDDESFAGYTGVSLSKKPFSAIMRNINYLLERGAGITIRFTLDENTAHNLKGIFMLFCTGSEGLCFRQVNRFKVRVVVPAGNVNPAKNIVALQDACDAFFETVKHYPQVNIHFKDGSRKLNIPKDLSNVTSPACICGEGSVHISSDLRNVSPCVFIRDMPEFNLGELRTGENSLESIWSKVTESKFSQLSNTDSACASHSIVEQKPNNPIVNIIESEEASRLLGISKPVTDNN